MAKLFTDILPSYRDPICCYYILLSKTDQDNDSIIVQRHAKAIVHFGGLLPLSVGFCCAHANLPGEVQKPGKEDKNNHSVSHNVLFRNG